MAFTEDEKARIRHHLGYPSWSSLASSINLGIPTGVQPLYLVEQAFERLLPGGEEVVRFDLCQCDAVEAQMGKARSRMAVRSADKVTFANDETEKLEKSLQRWVQKLASDMGCVVNPYDQSNGGGGLNAKVVG